MLVNIDHWFSAFLAHLIKKNLMDHFAMLTSHEQLVK